MNNDELTLQTMTAETAAALTCLSTDAPMPPFFKSLLIMRQRLHAENEASDSVWHIVCGKLLLAGINQMAETHPLWADILKSHYIDRMTMRGIAQKLGYENRYRLDRAQRKAIGSLAAILLTW